MNSKSSFMDDLSRESLLSIMQRIVKIFDRNAPLIEHVGKNKMSVLAAKADMDVPENDMDEFLNTASEKISDKVVEWVGSSEKQNIVLKGAALGLTAGLGVVLMDDEHNTMNFKSKEENKNKLTTVGLYVAGGILASIISHQLNKSKDQKLLENGGPQSRQDF